MPPKPEPFLGVEPPLHIINLSLPPRERYQEIARAHREALHRITPLFDAILSPLPCSKIISWTARNLVLRKVYDAEEQAEISGISEVIGIPVYLVIAFNTFLDMLMGCTSGAVKLGNGEDGEGEGSMVHFRTLDWGMEDLRALVVKMRYVRDGEVVAEGVSYAGYVGVLTGVRKGLSISLNFRPNIDATTRTAIAKLRYHQLLVLLGIRPSISHILKDMLLSQKSLADVLETFPSMKTSPAYITLCDSATAAFLEKDFNTARTSTSNDFIAGTNHDASMDSSKPSAVDDLIEQMKLGGNALMSFIEDSTERKKCITLKYENVVKSRTRARRTRGRTNDRLIDVDKVARWVEAYPTRNECTHFGCVMDPIRGEVVWVRSYQDDLDNEDEDMFSVSPEGSAA